MSTILTYSGKMVDILNYQATDFCIEDVAHSLSLKCRFSGHSSLFYSVSRHSINVYFVVKALGANLETQLWALLHDAPEYIIGDMPSPLKKVMPQFKEIDNTLTDRMIEAHDIVFPGWRTKIDFDLILSVDISMLLPEMGRFMNQPINIKGTAFYTIPESLIKLTSNWQDDEREFNMTYKSLYNELLSAYSKARKDKEKYADDEIPF